MRVAVVGAGLAGLRTAQLIEGRGGHVTLLEARSRIGGRIWSHQGIELGAEWVDGDHARVISLATELDLELMTEPRVDSLVFGGDMADSEADWPDVVKGREQLARLVARGEVAGLASDVLDMAATTERARWYLGARFRSDEGVEPSEMRAQAWLDGQQVYSARDGPHEMSTFRVSGGCSRLCSGIRNLIRGEIRLESPVQRVAVENGNAWVDGEPFDRVVIAVPAPLAPALGDWPLRSLKMAPVIKIGLTFRERFWGAGTWSGAMLADLPFQQVWPALGGQPVLMCYVCGDDARRTSPDHMVESFFGAVPAARDLHTGTVVCNWSDDRWAQGGFSVATDSGEPPRVWTPWRESVMFAGEHTARWQGFMEGALESAERCAMEVFA